MKKLLPCPFCGSNATITKLTIPFENDLKRTRIFAKCANSDCDILPETDSYDTEEEAIEAWNTRSNPWHTGTPTEEGWYLVWMGKIKGNINERPAVMLFKNGDWASRLVANTYVAWQKIEPYEEAE